jgi:mannose-6-phosphate isomerase-like protein (cupin superfamily)
LSEAASKVEKVNIALKFKLFNKHWSPKIVGTVNDSYIKLVKVKGEFVWHDHKAEDELFLVMKGRLTVKTRDRDVDLQEGEFVVIPRGVEHKPVAGDEAYVMLVERNTTINTGDF